MNGITWDAHDHAAKSHCDGRSDCPLLYQVSQSDSGCGCVVGIFVATRQPTEIASCSSSVITSKAANSYHFKTGQRDWPSRTENVLLCRLLWWQVGFGTPASGATLEHVAVMQ